MTFCGDLPFVPSGIHHHLFENLRRMGHHCHGRKRLSGGRPQKFLPASGQKVLRNVHFTPGLAETVVAVSAPGDRNGRCKPGVFTHRTVAAARNRASGFGGDWQVRQQLPVGVGPDDRMPLGSREPKVRVRQEVA